MLAIQPVQAQEQTNSVLSIPENTEIEYAYAETYGDPFGRDDLPSVLIPSDEFALLLDRFRDFKTDKEPDLEMQEVASIRIVQKDGTISRICIYWANAKQSTISFSYKGVRCETSFRHVGGNGKPLDHALYLTGQLRRIGREIKNK